MSVRGSKNKIIIYVAGACSILFVILLYHNASQRLEAMEVSYERCHLNEESLSAQLQVNLEYKVRLEKSLQKEKSDHAQMKEELQNKLEDERQTREKENLEAINKFSALQQQYKFLQSQHEDVGLEFSKLRQLQLSEIEDKRQLEETVQSLKKELSALKESKQKESNMWKDKISKLEEENSMLHAQNAKQSERMEALEKLQGMMKTSPSDVKSQANLPLASPLRKTGGNESELFHGGRDGVSPASIPVKSSTAANKMEQELFPSANSLFANTSTPMINPQAVQDDERIPVAPVPQPRQESSSMKDAANLRHDGQNAAPKPEEAAAKDFANDDAAAAAPAQGVLRAPDIFNQFAHVPELVNYKRQQQKEAEKNDHGGEVGDEGEPVIRNGGDHARRWREGGFGEQPVIGNPVIAANGAIARNNAGYQYQAEDDGRKEEEDDDDVDGAEYRNVNDKMMMMDAKENDVRGFNVQMPFAGDKRDSVMLQPK